MALFRLLETVQAFGQPAELMAPARESIPEQCSPKELANHVVEAFFDKIVARFPKPGDCCPFSGLNRNQLYDLTATQRGKAAKVQSVSLREPGERSAHGFSSSGRRFVICRRWPFYQLVLIFYTNTHNY